MTDDTTDPLDDAAMPEDWNDWLTDADTSDLVATTTRDILNRSIIEYEEMGRKTIVATAILPNQFEVSVSAHSVRPEDHDPEIGQAVCREKLVSKVAELVALFQHPPLN